MIVPGRFTTILYVVLLILIVAAILALPRLSEELEGPAPVDTSRDLWTPDRRPIVLPPGVEWSDSSRFVFTHYTRPPTCIEHCDVAEVLDHLPAEDRTAGFACQLVVGLYIDMQGRVRETDITASAGVEPCDRAAEAWARTTRWTVAYHLVDPVAAWILQPVDVTVP